MKSQEFIQEVKVTRRGVRRLERDGTRVGIEFEMVVPGITVDSKNSTTRPDYDQDTGVSSIQQIVDFFEQDRNTNDDIDKLHKTLRGNFESWRERELAAQWRNLAHDIVEQYIMDSPIYQDEIQMTADLENTHSAQDIADIIQDLTRNAVRTKNEIYQEAREHWMTENEIDLTEEQWLTLSGLWRLSDVTRKFDYVNWPIWISVSDNSELKTLAREFRQTVRMPVEIGTDYKDINRELITGGSWGIEPDTSIKREGRTKEETGLEFISPPIDLAEIGPTINRMRRFAIKHNCYTNRSTGLHVNISVPNYSLENLDYVKLVLLIGDAQLLELFDRATGPATQYCASALADLEQEVSDRQTAKTGAQIADILERMRRGFDYAASRSIREANINRYYSVNLHENYVEFRAPGGDYLNPELPQYSTENLVRVIRRLALSLEAACDPDSHRDLYMKKLHRLILPQEFEYVDPTDPMARAVDRGRNTAAIPIGTDRDRMHSMRKLLIRVLAGDITMTQLRNRLVTVPEPPAKLPR